MMCMISTIWRSLNSGRIASNALSEARGFSTVSATNAMSARSAAGRPLSENALRPQACLGHGGGHTTWTCRNKRKCLHTNAFGLLQDAKP